MTRTMSIGAALAAAVLAVVVAHEVPSAQRRIVSGDPQTAVIRTWRCLTRSIADQSAFRPPAEIACETESARSPLRLAPRGPLRQERPLVAPAAPASLAARILDGTVELTWNAGGGGDPAASYVIEAGSASGLSDLVNVDTGTAATTLTATGVAPGTYFVRVRARNASGTSPASNEIIVIVGGGCSTPPGVPTLLTALVNGSAVTLAWERPAGPCRPTSYVIEAGSAPGLSNLAIVATGSDHTGFSAAAVPAGTYYVRVRAANAAGTSAPSNEAMFTIAPCAGLPGAPTGFSAAVSGGTVVLTWNAAGGSPTSYVVEAGTVSGGSNIAIIDTGTAATTLTAEAGPGTYYVRMRARNACGVSAPSAEIAVVVQPPGS
jgi:predicted phage tail protein